MLCYFDKVIDGKTKHVFLGLIEGDDVTVTSLLLKNPSILPSIPNLRFLVNPENNLALFSVTDTTGCQNMTSVYEKFQAFYNKEEKSFPKEYLVKLRDTLAKACNDKSLAAKWLVLLSESYKHFDSEPLSTFVGISANSYDTDFFDYTKEYLAELNQANVSPFTSISLSENVTKKQATCTDELFIQIPLPETITDEVDVYSLLPSRDAVCSPYGTLELDDMSQYKSNPAFPSSQYFLVEGQAKNNSLGIQDNERKFYDALSDWVKFNVKRAFPNTNPDESLVAIDGDSQQLLEDLVEMFYVWHWRHNINVPVRNSDYDPDDDNINSKYVFNASQEETSLAKLNGGDVSSSNTMHINAVILLHDFLQKASLELGYRAYLEAIIKLARWGERKCTAITFDGYNKEFVLGTNSVRNAIGDINDYSVELVDGKEYTPVCAIYNYSGLMDKKYFNSKGYTYNRIVAPVGLLVTKQLKNSAGDTIDVNQYITVIDLVKQLKNGTCNVAGISLDGRVTVSCSIEMDDTIQYSDLLSNYESNHESYLMDPFYRSPELQDLFLKMGVNNGNKVVKPSQFTIIQSSLTTIDLDSNLKKYEFSSIEELTEKRNSRLIRSVEFALNSNVGARLLPIVIQAAQGYKEGASFEDVANLYLDAMNSYSSEADFLGMTSMSLFGDAAPVVSAEPTVTAESVAVPESAPEPVAVPEPVGTSVTESTATPEPVGTATPEPAVTATPEPAVTATPEPVGTVTSVAPQAIVSGFNCVKQIPVNATIHSVIDKNGDIVGACASTMVKVMNNGKEADVRQYVFLTAAERQGYTATGTPIRLGNIMSQILKDLYCYQINRPEVTHVFFSSDNCIVEYASLIKQLLKNNLL